LATLPILGSSLGAVSTESRAGRFTPRQPFLFISLPKVKQYQEVDILVFTTVKEGVWRIG
jgi:hypothetical protein